MGAFRFKASLPDLPRGAERALIEQFRAIQSDLDDVRGPLASATPVVSADCTVKVGQFLMIAPPAAGMLVGIPAGNAQNISRSLRIAVVGGTLSPGAAVTIIGGQGTINGQAVLYLNSFRLVELVSCGALGWVC
jgi:hypothetical protein